MRTKKTNKTLSLKKVTVSSLSDGTLSRINAGGLEGEALRTRYTACNNGARNVAIITGLSNVGVCV